MDDREITELLLCRDERGLEAMQAKYGRFAYSVALGILRDPGDAEECVNDALVRLWNSVAMRRPDALKAYFVAVTRNLALNRLRDAHRERRWSGEADAPWEELGETLEAPAEDHDGEEQARRLGASIDRFLRTLPPRDCDIFVCRYYYLMPVSEIAAKNGLRENYIRNLLSRIRKKLRTQLEKEGFEL